MKYSLKGDRLKLDRLLNYAKRATTRAITWPAIFLPEGNIKIFVRSQLLKIQNSVPTELAINNGDVVVQIGTPWPQTMRRFRKRIGPNGRLVIFEAMQENFDRLVQAVADDKYDNVDIFFGAAWNERKSGIFLLSSHPGDHKIQQDDISMDNDLRSINAKMESIEVEFYKIDDVLENMGISSINHLSVTVNGAEYEVLKGAEKTLQNSTDIRVFSKAHARDTDGNPISDKIIPYLRSLDYQVVLSKGEPSSTNDPTWRYRSGDVFAWKTP